MLLIFSGDEAVPLALPGSEQCAWPVVGWGKRTERGGLCPGEDFQVFTFFVLITNQRQMAQLGIASPFHFRLLFWQIGFFPDAVSTAVTASSRAEWVVAMYFFLAPKFSLRKEGRESCYRCFSKPESVCTERAQLVASQFDSSQPGLFPVSGSGRGSVAGAAFC